MLAVLLVMPSGVCLAAAAIVGERCRRLYCQVARCRATLADATTEHPAETSP